jgi:alpha-D-ribose 1-methylphosphonate 5-triphosphate synthase subunit PhnH
MPRLLPLPTPWPGLGLAAAAVLFALLGAPTPVRAQAQTEAALMARLTLSLTRFVQWPGIASGDPLRVCVAQRDAAIARAFAEADGQLVNGRRIQVVKAPPVAGCSVLFVHASAERVPDLLRAASGGPVLIVSDADGTMNLGGMVEFVAVNDSIRFDVNMAAFRHAQLTVSSQVLRLARQVRE